jgi:arginine decarboxylase
MSKTYSDLIQRNYNFPQQAYDLNEGELTFYGLNIKNLIGKYGAPLRLTYLPRIGEQINLARALFQEAMVAANYDGRYHYCYCTKCSHIHPIVSETLKNKVNLETSSALDIDLIMNLYTKKEVNQEITLIHNGYKTSEYISKIVRLHDLGFKNSIIILDSTREMLRLNKLVGDRKIKIGLRMAINEELESDYTTSRLGIRPEQMLEFFNKHIKSNENVELKMLHFFVDSGINDSLYYWGEFQKALSLYIDLKKESATLDAFNLGGGFPIRNQLGFEYDYQHMACEIVKNIKVACDKEAIQEPDIYTEFGKYTVGESGAVIFEVLEQKQQSDNELWYIVNSSIMNTLPDTWSIQEKFTLLPINKWKNTYSKVNIGGMSCDHSDFYNQDGFKQQTVLPDFSDEDDESLYLGFFHTGAYQEAISGYGSIKHCLIPAPKHVIVDKDELGNFNDYLYGKEQTSDEVLGMLGYSN